MTDAILPGPTPGQLVPLCEGCGEAKVPIRPYVYRCDPTGGTRPLLYGPSSRASWCDDCADTAAGDRTYVVAEPPDDPDADPLELPCCGWCGAVLRPGDRGAPCWACPVSEAFRPPTAEQLTRAIEAVELARATLDRVARRLRSGELVWPNLAAKGLAEARARCADAMEALGQRDAVV